ncbi:hypothetical protein OAJ71_02365 [Nitrosopumilus sp.]|nr:hypothetical protein [Nitrosopumilus sp.]MDC0228829.1 hypothetical protein [Nitrosopumilus sp.]RCL31461.1 MAG: hypothetical protein DBX08_04105 [Nitrosopumilus sp.]
MVINKKIILGITFFLIFSFILPINAETESPIKQMKDGISPENILCREGLELVIRINGMPACVKPETADRMQERGILLDTKIIKSDFEITTVPASSMSIVNFYITDHDLNLSHRGIEVISTEGLFEFTINGISIQGPERMIETGYDTGKFYLKLELPETINGKQLSQDDIVVIKYLDKSNQSGEQSIQLKSIPLTKTFAEIETFGGGSRIGHEFILRLYEPDANRDSRDEDKISISQLEFRSEGGIKTTLANPKFDANSNYLIETGHNTNIFEVQIKIPRQIDGKTIHIGDWYEIKYIDRTTPSNSDEKVIFKGMIG